MAQKSDGSADTSTNESGTDRASTTRASAPHTSTPRTRTPHTSTVEIERKYEVEAGTPLPTLDLSALPGLASAGTGAIAAGAPTLEQLEAVQLEAVYFDTPDAALARARVALRRRVGGHDEGWHLKLPAVEGRRELQWPLGDGAPGLVPDEVLDQVRVHVRDRPVTPLARISTSRRVTLVRDADGGLVLEVADDAVSTADLRGGTERSWREWEAELGAAAPGTRDQRAELLDAVERQLLAAGARVSPSVSKLAQALGRTGLGRTEPGTTAPGRPESSPDAVTPAEAAPAPHTSDPAADIAARAADPAAVRVRAGIAALVARMIELDPEARADRPDAVHEYRGTVRRLRTALAVHRGLFDADEVDTQRDSLARLGAALGEVRDLEVRAAWAAHALDQLESDRGVDDPDARRRLVDQTRAEHDEAHRRLVATLGRVPYFRLLDGLERFVADAVPGEPPVKGGKATRRAAKREARRTLAREGRRALRRAAAGAHARKHLDGDASESAVALATLHASRTGARRLRQAAEFDTEGPAAVLGGSAERTAAAAEALQDALGEHRDAALFAEFVLLTSRRADAEGESSFTYGVLYQRAIDQAERALDVADEAREALARAV
ncbi:CYTH and CHAD domain-containing protein [Herbiconiux moechotypicola]|uniref:CYTH and CHAD domain-containing protein n=1 Tax=Herbiconiux moechotypicola TaxID=637393 RepID=A0ABP5QJ56_9MICO|nr:CYTH and CHAD domain-containing protein [Herbiconiux moechotypicola]MCS5730384.1 CYTH and CHAD domain-containing protein [Herbiconiux moechotypicola]